MSFSELYDHYIQILVNKFYLVHACIFTSLFLLGNGVVMHIPQFFEELKELEAKGDPFSSTFFTSCYYNKLFYYYYFLLLVLVLLWYLSIGCRKLHLIIDAFILHTLCTALGLIFIKLLLCSVYLQRQDSDHIIYIVNSILLSICSFKKSIKINYICFLALQGLLIGRKDFLSLTELI